MEDPTITTPEWRGYHLRAVNAAIGLQAFALRDIAKRCLYDSEFIHTVRCHLIFCIKIEYHVIRSFVY